MEDPQVVVGHELGRRRLLAHCEGVNVPQDDHRDRTEKEGVLPDLPAVRVRPAHLPGEGRGLRAHAQELLVGPSEGCHGAAATG